jgi:alpha-tubulin suppressor-like RCC1 family protein
MMRKLAVVLIALVCGLVPSTRFRQDHVVGATSPVLMATFVSVGTRFSCAVTTGGGVKCWGENQFGQLGDNTTDQRSLPVDVVGLTSGVVSLAAGGHHACALTSDGAVKCWGYNGAGTLGDSTTDDRHTPVAVIGLSSGVTAISAGRVHTCALLSGGAVKCWGWNQYGQLGDDTTDMRSTPVGVNGLPSGIRAIEVGAEHTCALTATGGVKCWGRNNYGALGDGTMDDRHLPVDVLGLGGGVSALAAGLHTCALIDGAMKCWGLNGNGQLGIGLTTPAWQTIPNDVQGLNGLVKAIVTGESHTCAVMAGSVRCWGGNGQGQLGDGTKEDRTVPTQVIALSGGSVFAANAFHTCTVTGCGSVACWGLNDSGQIGDGTKNERLAPVPLSGGSLNCTMLPLILMAF